MGIDPLDEEIEHGDGDSTSSSEGMEEEEEEKNKIRILGLRSKERFPDVVASIMKAKTVICDLEELEERCGGGLDVLEDLRNKMNHLLLPQMRVNLDLLLYFFLSPKPLTLLMRTAEPEVGFSEGKYGMWLEACFILDQLIPLSPNPPPLLLPLSKEDPDTKTFSLMGRGLWRAWTGGLFDLP